MGSPANFIDLSNRTFGKLRVLRRGITVKKNNQWRARWICKCECGTETTVDSRHLIRGKISSCGCLSRKMKTERKTTHGRSRDRVYNIWIKMHDRCKNPNNISYERYGGRGISVCNEWKIFEKFLVDMGEPPKGYSIERIDNNGMYNKENCRWATNAEQSRNKRNNILIEYKNKTLCLAEWCEILALKYETINARYKRGERNPERLFSGSKLLS